MKSQPKPARVFHFDLYGKREAKYDFLHTESLASIPWTELDCPEPYCFFVPKDFGEEKEYSSWISLSELFPVTNSGVSTDRDPLFISFEKNDIFNRFQILLNGDYDKRFIEEYRIIDSGSYKITSKIMGVRFSDQHLTQIQYRIFDFRFTYYDKKIVSRPAQKAMSHIFRKNNVGLIFKRQAKIDVEGYSNFFLTNTLIINGLFAIDPFGREVLAPLYLYPEETAQNSLDAYSCRQPNLNLQIVAQIAEKLGLRFTLEKEENPGAFAPIDLLDYIYAVLHSPAYREKYKEFLKIDFPRVPYPKDVATFWQLVALGGELRQIHLLESPVVSSFITGYPVGGSNVVEKVRYEGGNVYINDIQHFTGVPEAVWKFYIGGYQPAQKWLKDRKERELQFDDILHYQKIIAALSETDRMMKEIDEIEIE